MLKHAYFGFWNKIVAPMDKKKSAHIKTPDDIDCVKDIRYGEKSQNTFDVYTPINSVNRLPLIINLHGGGYVYGDKSLNEEMCVEYSKNGFCVICANYSLVTKTNSDFIESVEDVFKLFRYIKKNFSQNQIDFDNVFLTGDSSGAHLASLVTAISKNPLMQLDFNIISDIDIQGCAFFSGVFGSKMLNNILFNKKNPLSSICHTKDIMSEKFPPFVMISASNDPLLYSSKQFDKRCRELGLIFDHLIIDKPTCFGHIFNVKNPALEKSKIANDFVINYFYDLIKENKLKNNNKNEKNKTKTF